MAERLSRMCPAMALRIPSRGTDRVGSGSPGGMFGARCASSWARTSASVTLPRGPVGVTWEMSTPRLAASRLAPGVDGTTSPAGREGAAGLLRAVGPFSAGADGAGGSGGASPSAKR